MVIGPAELTHRSYDVLVVDEAHRLRQRVNLGNYYRNFDQAATAMGFDKYTCSEVDWVELRGRKAIISDQAFHLQFTCSLLSGKVF